MAQVQGPRLLWLCSVHLWCKHCVVYWLMLLTLCSLLPLKHWLLIISNLRHRHSRSSAPSYPVHCLLYFYSNNLSVLKLYCVILFYILPLSPNEAANCIGLNLGYHLVVISKRRTVIKNESGQLDTHSVTWAFTFSHIFKCPSLDNKNTNLQTMWII